MTKHDYEKFIYEKKIIFRENTINYAWHLINKETREGMEFHGAYCRSESNFFPYGIEMHKTSPFYAGQEPIDNCSITLGTCYCSGSSLLGRELLGHIDPENREHDAEVYDILHKYFDIWILEEDDD